MLAYYEQGLAVTADFKLKFRQLNLFNHSKRLHDNLQPLTKEDQHHF